MGAMPTKPKTHRSALEKAISAAGSKQDLLEKLNARGWSISSQNVISQWLVNGVPAKYCPDIEELTKVPCEALCPEVKWGLVRNRRKQARGD